jgi:hypothetical protein
MMWRNCYADTVAKKSAIGNGIGVVDPDRDKRGHGADHRGLLNCE